MLVGLTKSFQLLILGVVGMLGSDDLMACFAAGQAFAWDDLFRSEVHDSHIQEVIDNLLNLSFFVLFGALIPWNLFNSDVIPLWQLFVLAICK